MTEVLVKAQMIRRLLTPLLIVAAFSSALAQTDPPSPNRSCFRGRPLTECRSFWITEASYSVRLSSVDRQVSFEPGGWFLPTVELGGMRNLNGRVAVGASIGAGFLGDFYLAAKPRVRLWLSPKASLDLSPGLMLGGRTGIQRFTADASLMWSDRVGVTAHSFVVPVTTFPAGEQVIRNRRTVYLGLRLGSKLGVGGAAADALGFLAVIGAYFIACANNGCD